VDLDVECGLDGGEECLAVASTKVADTDALPPKAQA
jgi:hypothetical protein